MPESSPWGIMLNLAQRKLTKHASSFKYRSSKLYWVQMEYCEYRLEKKKLWHLFIRLFQAFESRIAAFRWWGPSWIVRGQNDGKKKKESRGDMSSQFVFGSFSLSIFLPALYYLNAWNKLLVDYSNIKKMQPLLNWQRYKGLFCFIVVFVNL